MSDDSEKIAGMAIMSMARDIDEKDAEIDRLRKDIEEDKEEIKMLRGFIGDWPYDVKPLELAAARDAEIEALRLENSQWQSACAGYTEALAARDKDNAALLEELARIRDQIAKHNISIKEAIRRGEAFEWKTLTLDS